MTTYTYTRELINGLYNIDNEFRLDGDSKNIYLAKEIEAMFPGKIFNVKCNDGILKVNFDIALSSGEETTLNQIALDHKDNR